MNLNPLQPLPFVKIAELSGHTGSIYQLLKISESEFLTASGDGMIAKWSIQEVSKGISTAKIPFPIFTIDCLDKWMILGGQSNKIYVINSETGFNQIIELSETITVFCAKIINDNIALIGSDKGLIHKIDYKNGVTIDVIKLSDKSIRSIIKNAEMQHWIGDSTGAITLYDFTENKLISHNNQSNDGITSLIKIDKLLYSGDKKAILKKWKIEDENNLILLKEQNAHLSSIYKIISINSHDGIIATASRDKSIRFWLSNELMPLASIQPIRDKGHQHSVNDIIYYPHQKILVSAGDDKKIILWEIDEEHLQLIANSN